MTHEKTVSVNELIDEFDKAMEFNDVSKEEREKIIGTVIKNIDEEI